jgi:hypothetical protein
MIFDEKKIPKLHQTGSGRIPVTASDRDSGPKLRWAIFYDFDEKSQKLPRT